MHALAKVTNTLTEVNAISEMQAFAEAPAEKNLFKIYRLPLKQLVEQTKECMLLPKSCTFLLKWMLF